MRLIIGLACIIAGASILPESAEAQDSSTTSVGIDHVILRTGILSQGTAEFARVTGVTPLPGGKHPGKGTQNALVSLGQGRYLELIAPVVDSSSTGPLLVDGWALHTDQLEGLGRRLRAKGLKLSDPSPGSRKLPSGSLLKWATAGMPDSGYSVAPFFIQWDTSSPHPSRTSPGGCTLQSLTVTDTPPYRTIELLRAVGVSVPVHRGTRPGLKLELECPKGRVRFVS